MTDAPRPLSEHKPEADDVTGNTLPADAPRPVGRPSEYDPAFCAVVIDCGKQGFSKAEIAAELDVSRPTLDAWAKAHPEFLDAVQRASDLSLAWWEKEARTGLKNREFNSTLWGRAISGRFPREPYRERVEHTGAEGGPVQVQRVERVIVRS